MRGWPWDNLCFPGAQRPETRLDGDPVKVSVLVVIAHPKDFAVEGLLEFCVMESEDAHVATVRDGPADSLLQS